MVFGMKKGALSPTTKQKHSIQINNKGNNNSQAVAGDESSYANQFDQLDEVVAASSTTATNHNTNKKLSRGRSDSMKADKNNSASASLINQMDGLKLDNYLSKSNNSRGNTTNTNIAGTPGSNSNNILDFDNDDSDGGVFEDDDDNNNMMLPPDESDIGITNNNVSNSINSNNKKSSWKSGWKKKGKKKFGIGGRGGGSGRGGGGSSGYGSDSGASTNSRISHTSSRLSHRSSRASSHSHSLSVARTDDGRDTSASSSSSSSMGDAYDDDDDDNSVGTTESESEDITSSSGGATGKKGKKGKGSGGELAKKPSTSGHGSDSAEDYTDDEDEGEDGYKPGGYHPVKVGEVYNQR